MAHLRRRLAIIATAILATLLFGTVGFVLIDGYPVFDAFYMTLTTVTTVGYGEILPLSHAGRIFNSFLIFFGVSVMLLAFGPAVFVLAVRRWQSIRSRKQQAAPSGGSEGEA